MKCFAMIVEKYLLKNFLLVFPLCIILTACSTTQYTYYFSKYANQNNASSEMQRVSEVDLLLVNRNMSTESSSLPFQKETTITSTSKEEIILITTELIEVDKRIDTAFPAMNESSKKEIAKQQQVFYKAQVIKENEIRKGNKKKNGFAIIGFIFSIMGLLLFVLSPVALLLCGFGALFSLFGIKSEKRKLAIAGLIIGLVGFGIVYLYALISGLGYS